MFLFLRHILQREIYSNFGARGLSVISDLKEKGILEFVQRMISFEKQDKIESFSITFRSILNLESSLPTGTQINPNCSIADLLLNPGCYAPRHTVCICEFTPERLAHNFFTYPPKRLTKYNWKKYLHYFMGKEIVQNKNKLSGSVEHQSQQENRR